MNEKYLHYLWQNKLLPFHKMDLTTGEHFKIIYPGDYNESESGPDFSNAIIEIDALRWVGNVELHVNSSDWYQHNHNIDQAYDNVILHVVHKHNREVVQQGRKIPTLELKHFIDDLHFKKYAHLVSLKKKILCASLIKEIQPIDIIGMQDLALFRRLNRKTEYLNEFSKDHYQAFYSLMAKAMGGKVNQLPFEELTRRLPLVQFRKLNKKRKFEMVLIASGLDQPENAVQLVEHSRILNQTINRSNLTCVSPSSWKFGGIRPGASPEIRIHQFAALVSNMDFDLHFECLNTVDFYGYLKKLFSFDQVLMNEHPKLRQMTDGFKDHLMINCVVPYMFWKGNMEENSDMVQRSLDLLRLIGPESNSVLKKWGEAGVLVENAYESQAMLEIFNEFCNRKKCLSCRVGKRILGQ